jgi:hypothetical protein
MPWRRWQLGGVIGLIVILSTACGVDPEENWVIRLDHFHKIGSSGAGLTHGAANWSCVEDNLTGLWWEKKTQDGGVQDESQTYRWDQLDNYVRTINSAGLCGHHDWRVPTIEELRTLVIRGRFPTIDEGYFPNTGGSSFWSGSPFANDSSFAWFVGFNYGYDNGSNKSSSYGVRVVRDGQ